MDPTRPPTSPDHHVEVEPVKNDSGLVVPARSDLGARMPDPIRAPSPPTIETDTFPSAGPAPAKNVSQSLDTALSVTSGATTENQNSDKTPRPPGEAFRHAFFYSQGTWVSAGSVCFCIAANAPVAAGLFLGIGMLAIWNRYKLNRSPKKEEVQEKTKEPGSSSFLSRVKSAANYVWAQRKSPSVDFFFASANFAIASAFIFANTLSPIAIIPTAAWALGELRAGIQARRKAEGEKKGLPPVEPNPFKRVLLNPALWFAGGSIVENVVVKGVRAIVDPTPAGIFMGIGLALGGAAAIYGSAEALLSPKRPTGWTFRMHAASNFFYGLSYLCAGDMLRGTGFIAWSISGVQQANQLDEEGANATKSGSGGS